MAVPNKSKYVILPIEKEWSNFSIEHGGKDVHLKGFDGKTTDWFSKEPEVVYLKHFEQHWKDLCHHEIFDEGFGEYGERFLILKRTHYDDIKKCPECGSSDIKMFTADLDICHEGHTF